MAILLTALAMMAATPQADLRIAVWPEGQDGPKHVWTLQCGPTGGTLPDAAAACAKLGRFTKTSPFAPVPSDRACTALFSGPEEALVTGTFRGKRVWARFNRRDGCQTERWKRLEFLFVKSA